MNPKCPSKEGRIAKPEEIGRVQKKNEKIID
jgi:hypothetical protein